jgi:hypothetical protein
MGRRETAAERACRLAESSAPDLVNKTLTEIYAAWWPADQDWPPMRRPRHIGEPESKMNGGQPRSNQLGVAGMCGAAAAGGATGMGDFQQLQMQYQYQQQQLQQQLWQQQQQIMLYQQRPPGAAPPGDAAQGAGAAPGAGALLGGIAPGGENCESPAAKRGRFVSELPLEERLAKLDALLEKGLISSSVCDERKSAVLGSAGF